MAKKKAPIAECEWPTTEVYKPLANAWHDLETAVSDVLKTWDGLDVSHRVSHKNRMLIFWAEQRLREAFDEATQSRPISKREMPKWWKKGSSFKTPEELFGGD